MISKTPNNQKPEVSKFKTRQALERFLKAEDFKMMICDPFQASYRDIRPHVDSNGGYNFRFFQYLGRSKQPALFLVGEEEHVIEHGAWVLFNCFVTHSCSSSDWMTFSIWGCDYRYRLESFSNRV